MRIQAKDPVIAVLIRDQEETRTIVDDHETRIRPLEIMRAQLLVLAFLGAAVGAAVINFLFQRLGV